MSKLKRYPFFILILILLICQCPFTAAAGNPYISDAAAFQKALKEGKSVIYVGDFSFEKETNISLNYNVKIIGKSKKSSIKNALFTVVGANVSGESVDVSFENVILDGCIDKKNYDFSVSGKTFAEVFGSDRAGKRAIYGTWGYFSLSMNNCEITRYAAYEGPAIYIDNNATFRDGKRVITLKNSEIHNNICYGGTVVLGNDNGIYTVENCLFTGNTAKSAGGAVLSNGTATVKNCDFSKNAYYRFVELNEDGTEKYPNDKITVNKKEYNKLNFSGTLYIGASDAVVENCRITENEGLYGGGVGATSPYSTAGGEKIEFINCEISKNSAECGGAIYALSNQGHNINFINCNIFGNRATKGGILFTTTIMPYTNDVNIVYGGKVSFIFCSMAENTDTDAGSFGFYHLRMPKFAGVIEHCGCMVIDNAVSGNNKQSYIATREKALSDGAVTAGSLAGVYNSGLAPLSGSPADISVSADVYSEWATSYSGATASKKIGAHIGGSIGYSEKSNSPQEQSGSSASESVGQTESSRGGKIVRSGSSNGTSGDVVADGSVTVKPLNGSGSEHYASEITELEESEGGSLWWISIPIAAAVICVAVLLIILLKKKNQTDGELQTAGGIESLSYEELMPMVKDKLAAYSLTNKELQVATMLLICEKRKEIAEKLFISEDTAKSHISHIFKKVGVSSRQEFRKIAKDLLK